MFSFSQQNALLGLRFGEDLADFDRQHVPDEGESANLLALIGSQRVSAIDLLLSNRAAKFSRFFTRKINRETACFLVPTLPQSSSSSSSVVPSADHFCPRNPTSEDGRAALCLPTNQTICLPQKAALVWPGAPDNGMHPKAGSVCLSGGGALANSTSANSGRPVSPGSGLAHWVTMMTDHAHGSGHGGPQHHDNVHYMWNGIEVSHFDPVNRCEIYRVISLQKRQH